MQSRAGYVYIVQHSSRSLKLDRLHDAEEEEQEEIVAGVDCAEKFLICFASVFVQQFLVCIGTRR